MEIIYTKIKSSNIIGYHYNISERKLYVKFSNQREYEYSNVTQHEVDQIVKAESFGKKLKEIVSNKKYKELD